MKAYDDYSDDDLAAIAGVDLKKAAPQDDYSQYSDEDLMKIVGVDPQKVTKTESFGRGALQSATLGLSDEAYGGTRSFTRDISRGIENKLYGDNMLSPISYEQAREGSAAANKSAQEANPGSYLAGEITGAVGTGATGAATKTGAAIGNFVRGSKIAKNAGTLTKAGSAILRGAKSAIVAAPTGAIYGAGTAEPGDRIEGAKLGAKYAGIGGAASPAVGAAVSRVVKDTGLALVGIAAKNSDQIESVISKFSKNANQHYAAMREEGARIAPTKTKELFSAIDSKLRERGILNPALHGKTIAVLDDLKAATKRGALDLETLDQQRRVLSRIRATADNAEDAGMARAAVKVINEIEDSISDKDLTKGTANAVQQLKAGRAESRKAIKLDEIADILRRADGDPNRIKAGLTSFVNKKENLHGFMASEQEALLNAARSSAPEKLLKMAGKFGIDLGTSLTPGNTLLPLAGGYGVSPLVPVGGTIARQLQKYLARGKAEEALRIIERGGIPKDLGKLPPRVAKSIIENIKSLQRGGDEAFNQQIISNVGVAQ